MKTTTPREAAIKAIEQQSGATEITDEARLVEGIAKPELKEGEIYVGAIIGANGHGHHVILLSDHPKERMTWQEAMDWSKSVGGDLPNRIEQALLYDQKKAEFAEDWHWSNAQHAADAAYAWYQNFGFGHQGGSRKGDTLRARAVRRVLI